MTPIKIAIVTPVYNDWDSFEKLVQELDSIAGSMAEYEINIVAVDDGSDWAPGLFPMTLANIASMRVVELFCNLGHQRAIAVGLTVATELQLYDAVVVMDSDGEDQPSDLPDLIRTTTVHDGHIVVARRAQRSEGPVFVAFHILYKKLFRLMTGHNISFGNFCIIPRALVEKLIHTPSVWNNLAASIVRARMPIFELPTRRGTRYSGTSKMNLISLIVHGLSAISVYSEVVFVRTLLGFFSVGLLTLAGMLLAAGIRFWTDLAIPGWTTNVVGILTVVLFQSLMMASGAVFTLLYSRAAPSVIPVTVARDYIKSIELRYSR